MRYRLGLDMGTSSIGWAVVEMNDLNEPEKTIAMGVRKFNSGREDKTQAPLAQKRRQKRSMRRQRARFLRRQQRLLHQLGKLSLMPEAAKERRMVADCTHPSFATLGANLNPYELRALALEKPLPPFALGRVLFALNQRRGFKSNRGENTEPNSKAFEEGIGKLEQAIADGGFATLGAYFAHRQRLNQYILDARGQNEAVEREGVQTTRKMYEDEFDAIRKAQQVHHKLSDKDWNELKDTIFNQRSLKEVERGKCQFYGPQGLDGVFRAYAADPLAQKLRAWQDINNLKVSLPENDGKPRFLNDEERQILWQLLQAHKTIGFSTIRTKLKLPADVTFNLSSAKSGDKLLGLQTDIDMADPKRFGTQWHSLSPEEQTAVIELLQGTKDEEEVIHTLVEIYGLSEEAAETTSNMKLEAGTARFCPKILAELASQLASIRTDPQTNRYISLTEALADMGGTYLPPDQLVEHLGYYAAMMPEVGMHQKFRTVPEERKFGVIGNPTVHIALNQLRHLVNAITDQYGKPASIAIELARDLKQNAEQKRESEARRKKNEADRKAMQEECKKAGVNFNPDSREDWIKYRLWKELDKDPLNRKCVYTGKTISLNQLFSNDIHIEHILPRSRTLDDSIANLTLAFRDANKMKGNQTPFEYYKDKPEDYEAVLQRAKNLKGKYWRFTAEAMSRLDNEERWLSSMLNDTRYMSKLARRYLSYICDDIQVSPGKLTAKARHQWFGRALEKNREEDHRHHAVDALTVALLTRGAVQKAQIEAGKGEDLKGHAYEKLDLPCPMDKEELRKQALALLGNMVVSHRMDHGIQGALHKETSLAYTKKGVQKFMEDQEHATMLVPIKHRQGDTEHINYYEHGGVHHIDFWEVPQTTDKETGKTKKAHVVGVPVYAHEANPPKGKAKKQTRPHPASTFIMRLHKGDAVALDKDNQNNQIVIVRQINPSKGNENLVYDPVNQPADTLYTLGFSSLLKYNTRKAYVDILGNVKVGRRN